MTPEDRIKRFLEKGSSQKRERLIQLFYTHYINRKVLDQSIRNLKEATFSIPSHGETIEVTSYKGTNNTAVKIASLFNQLKPPAVLHVIVHGSISSNDEINYSDFDGILIIDEQKIESINDIIKLRKLIVQTEELMYEQDALQHHGWKIFLRKDFANYPDDDFPLDLIKTGTTIYPVQSPAIRATIKTAFLHYERGFYSLTNSILKKCSNKPKDLFAFKVLCSEIMLLPAFFLQAIWKKTVAKKESFSLMHQFFILPNQDIIEQVSQWRSTWQQPEMNAVLHLFHTLRKSGIYIPTLAPDIPSNIKSELTADWYHKTEMLCKTLHAIVFENQPYAESGS